MSIFKAMIIDYFDNRDMLSTEITENDIKTRETGSFYLKYLMIKVVPFPSSDST